MTETPRSEPTELAAEGDEQNEASPTPAVSSSQTFTIASDVVIPRYAPLDVPYSEWEAHRSQELLQANGFGDSAEEWRRATQHTVGLIRSSAYYLLTRLPEQQDEALFGHGLDDSDLAVQALSAYGLFRLGDQSVLPIVEGIAQLDVNAYTAAPRAAGILAEAGEPTAFATIEKAINSERAHVRLFAIQNAPPFVLLHGQPFDSGKTIDIWEFYKRALQDDVDQVWSTAKLQLQELNTPEAAALLEEYTQQR